MDEANASSLSFRMEVDDEREESEAHSQPHSHPQSQSHLPSSVGTEVKSSSIEESDICGFAYDPSTKRYYRIQSDASGSAIGFRKRDYERVRRETDRLSQFQMTAKQPPAPSSSHQLFDVNPQIKPIVTSLVQARELGYKSTQITNFFHCGLSESALLSASNTPNYTREVS
ncbi:unnamed protein product [Anisakis simplex]|uniref:AP2/ERF domain-containing protein n=1 Tax=Anisakis simplex TaxID=6269 RepID=A0A0M3JH19_ANISI|nr:unnamed protein product [Anisakis simplex]